MSDSWGWDDAGEIDLTRLPPPDPAERVDRPSPFATAAPAPAPAPSWSAPLEPMPVVQPMPVAPAAEISVAPAVVGFTTLPTNRAILLLIASGARLTSSDRATAWLEVPGARIVVLAGDRTRLLVDAPDPARRERITDVVVRSLQREDPGVALQPSRAMVPEPGPMPVEAGDGWYPDPFAAAVSRRWDGRRWTAETRG